MSDFEMAAVRSLNKKFPGSNLTGCWFHFNQVQLFEVTFNQLLIVYQAYIYIQAYTYTYMLDILLITDMCTFIYAYTHTRV